MRRRLLPLIGRLLLSALLLFLILVVGFYTLWGALFAVDSGNGWGALIWMAAGGGLVFLLGWWIARLWLRKEAGWR